MPYFPLSQILTNLYTPGGEYGLKTTKRVYIGHYHETSDGSKYSGKIPRKSSILLVPLNPVTLKPILETPQPVPGDTIRVLNERYSITDSEVIIDPKTNLPYPSPDPFYQDDSKPRSIPQVSPSYPTKEEKLKKIYTRYFCKRNNELRYFEINKETFNSLIQSNPGIASDLYNAASLLWKIGGDKEKVFFYNKKQALSVGRKKKWPGFSQYFKGNFTQFYLED